MAATMSQQSNRPKSAGDDADDDEDGDDGEEDIWLNRINRFNTLLKSLPYSETPTPPSPTTTHPSPTTTPTNPTTTCPKCDGRPKWGSLDGR